MDTSVTIAAIDQAHAWFMPQSPVVAQTALWPLAVYFGVTVFMTAGLLLLSYFLGQRHRETETGKPYESGIVSTGTARVRFDVKFYQNAIFFVIFDLEAMFIIAWAVAIRETAWSGYVEILIFIGILAAALAYLWREGALDWGPPRQKLDVRAGVGQSRQEGRQRERRDE